MQKCDGTPKTRLVAQKLRRHRQKWPDKLCVTVYPDIFLVYLQIPKIPQRPTKPKGPKTEKVKPKSGFFLLK